MAPTRRGSGNWTCHHHSRAPLAPFQAVFPRAEKRLPSRAPCGEGSVAVVGAAAKRPGAAVPVPPVSRRAPEARAHGKPVRRPAAKKDRVISITPPYWSQRDCCRGLHDSSDRIGRPAPQAEPLRSTGGDTTRKRSG